MKLNYKGGMLFELLIIVVILVSLLPMFFVQNRDRLELKENIFIKGEMESILLSLNKYIETNKLKLEHDNLGHAKTILLKELKTYGFDYDSVDDSRKYILRIHKSSGKKGDIYIQGLVGLEIPTFSLLRLRKLSMLIGENGGFQDSYTLRGNYNTWEDPISMWNLKYGKNNIVVKTDISFRQTSYINRYSQLDMNNNGNQMFSDLLMNYNNIEDGEFLISDTLSLVENLDSKIIELNLFEVFGTLEVDKNLVIRDYIEVDGSASVSNTIDGLEVLKIGGLSTEEDDISTSRIGNLTSTGNIYSQDLKSGRLEYDYEGDDISQTSLNSSNSIYSANIQTENLFTTSYGSVETSKLNLLGIFIDKNNSDIDNPKYYIDARNKIMSLENVILSDTEFYIPLEKQIATLKGERDVSQLTNTLLNKGKIRSITLNEYILTIEDSLLNLYARYCNYCKSLESVNSQGACAIRYNCD
ncbi:MAG: hypothetical protein JJV93_02790 [Alphaproteobacteria bacterium]|nr:hypothetical protein [Alphaproteobacteria bacterium]MBL0718155.1 hypothetical protein [Alphaproteobacteria bacterium]